MDSSIALFAYDFPHWKSEQLLRSCIKNSIKVKLVIAAPKIDLESKAIVESEPSPLLRSLCQSHNITFLRCPHDDHESIMPAVRKLDIKIGVIGGARKIGKEIIQLFEEGIINYHPGRLPDTAGLNAVERAITLGIGVEVTAHLINEKLDDGLKLLALPVPIFHADDIQTLKQRCLEYQVILHEVCARAYIEGSLKPKPVHRRHYNQKMSSDEILKSQSLFNDWKLGHSSS